MPVVGVGVGVGAAVGGSGRVPWQSIVAGVAVLGVGVAHRAARLRVPGRPSSAV